MNSRFAFSVASLRFTLKLRATGAFLKKGHQDNAIFVTNLFCEDNFRFKFILRLLECKIYFAIIGVQNLFCDYWSAKFILRLLECKIYFAIIGVQNLFCDYWSACYFASVQI